ncbi:hypothetical protein [Myxacorys almedinensis]|uniref:PEP-CTERM sorting domain-containing protein n=1 Tax=Myxacorys almedinensis A TaxID=2690445 RepID=A0A8J7Z140_9CYAN|nr:hypothetical protein [Myxacorys almedinensis]NDJ16208.1 hypothetical protein [Myxacorys almedinensis A]
MTSITGVPSVSKSNFVKNAACALAVTGAALLPLSVPTVASAFTVGQTTASFSLNNVRGQSFTPSNIGPNGTGTPPVGNVQLSAFTYAYASDVNRTANTLYIYNFLPALADLNTGTGNLYASTGFTDSVGGDSRFNPANPSRTFTFAGANLDANTTYYALFSLNQAIRDEDTTNPYSGHFEYVDNGNLSTTSFTAAFIADFTPTPVPFVFNPLLGLGWVGLSKARKALRQRRNEKRQEVAQA